MSISQDILDRLRSNDPSITSLNLNKTGLTKEDLMELS